MISSKTWVIPIIVAVNVAVYVMWNFASNIQMPFLYENFLVSWNAIFEGRYWTLLTSVFSHRDFFHIFFNMFVLINFGPIIEQLIGAKRFFGFYIVAGVFSSYCHAAVSNVVLNEPSIPALGASGALAGIILLFSLFFPREKILIFGILPMPAVLGALAFIGLDIWGLIAQSGGGGLPIGHGAHLGGAFIGILYFVYLRLRGFRIRR